MLITFSRNYPQPESMVTEAARLAHAFPKIRWARPGECRFVLTLSQGNAASASNAAHDTCIRALLMIDPLATVRTARANYEGLRDFEAQVKARVA